MAFGQTNSPGKFTAADVEPLYGSCNTPKSEHNKTVDIPELTKLVRGLIITVKFTFGVESGENYLNVNGTGDFLIEVVENAYLNDNRAYCSSNAVVQLMYFDGRTNPVWIMLASCYSAHSMVSTRLFKERKLSVDLGSTSPALFDGSEDVVLGISGGVVPVKYGGTGGSTPHNAVAALMGNLKNVADVDILDYFMFHDCSGSTASQNAYVKATLKDIIKSARGSAGYGVKDGLVGRSEYSKVVEINSDVATNDMRTGLFGSAEGSETFTCGHGAEVFNLLEKVTIWNNGTGIVRYPNFSIGKFSHSEGYGNISYGEATHTEGVYNLAYFHYSHVEGIDNMAGNYEHKGAAIPWGAHAEGRLTKALADTAHSENHGSIALGSATHAGGWCGWALAAYSFAHGECVRAKNKNEFVIGSYNKCDDPDEKKANATSTGDIFVVGKGTMRARANAFRVSNAGVYGTSAFNNTGADYAELFQWFDGNPNKEDRIGRFITLDGEFIRYAEPGEFILGILSGNPSVVGDVHDDQWKDMYVYDIYGRPVWEDVEVPDEIVEGLDPENPDKMIKRVAVPAHTEHRQKINPEYDHTQEYIPRSERPEWSAVGMMGKLVVEDDGNCQVNGWCTSGHEGIAVPSEEQTRYRVLSRVDDTHIRVLIL